jgi:hypothetical protein
MDRKTVKASAFSDAQKVFIFNQGAAGLPPDIDSTVGKSSCIDQNSFNGTVKHSRGLKRIDHL